MRRFCRLAVFPRFGLVLAFVVVLTTEANADLSVNNIGLYDTSNAPTAWISFTGSNGYVDVYADPQTATNWTSHGSPIALYCTDTTHDNAVGDTYSVNAVSSMPLTSTPSYSDAASRVAWALEQTATTADARGAVQLLVWAIVDNQFAVNWGETNNSGLQSAYSALSGEMLANYNPNASYQGGVEFLAADHVGSLYQNLAFVVTPEPSALVIAAVGALGMIGYGLRRRGDGRAITPSDACLIESIDGSGSI
jgi:hypothetical protein